jgi:hypothetical protein
LCRNVRYIFVKIGALIFLDPLITSNNCIYERRKQMMKNNHEKISLGFTEEKFEQGVHICQIYGDDEERHNALINYIISGLHDKENTICFTENETEMTLARFFEQNGVSYKETIKSGEFNLSKTSEVYFEGDRFEPDRMLERLRVFYETSARQNRSGARVIGEMLSEISTIHGGERLLEYESKVSLLIKRYPVTTVCQYDAREFDGTILMDILKVHPYIFIRGAVVRNPFFIPPEEYLSKYCSR